MKLTHKIVSAVALSGVIAFAGVQAGELGGDHHNKRGKNIERMAKYLELSDEQRANIKTIMMDFKAQHQRPDREEMKEKHQQRKAQFAALMAAAEFDEAAVSQHLAQQSAKHTQMKLNKLKLQHAIYQELTPEQQPKYLKMVQKRMKKMKHKMMRNHHENGSHHGEHAQD